MFCKLQLGGYILNRWLHPEQVFVFCFYSGKRHTITRKKKTNTTSHLLNHTGAVYVINVVRQEGKQFFGARGGFVLQHQLLG